MQDNSWGQGLSLQRPDDNGCGHRAVASELADLGELLALLDVSQLPGLRFDLSKGRLWIVLRGDILCNWRFADGHYVFETPDGQFAVTSKVDGAVTRTMMELADYLPDAVQV
jgi:hypothetical protein